MFEKLHLMQKRTPPGPGRKRQSGVAAVEFAIIFPLLLILIVFPIFLSRVFMHYSVAQKAAHDAALYLARVPSYEVTSQSMFGANVNIARDIAMTELAELFPGADSPVYVGVLCDNFPCGPSVPKNIRVTVQMRMYDDFFGSSTWPLVGDEGILLTAEMNIPYLGK